MEKSHACILYQNQLFGEGLESILNQHRFLVTKYPIIEVQKRLFEQVKIILLEINWPFVGLEKKIDEYFNEIDHCKVILIPNLVNKLVVKLIRRGKISGVVLKRSSIDELFFAIKQVLEGKRYYSTIVANMLLKETAIPVKVKITKREKQILSMLADMKTTSEIAKRLSISSSTVKTHRRNLMQKFNAKNQLYLLKLACRENLLNEDSHYCCCCYKQVMGMLN